MATCRIAACALALAIGSASAGNNEWTAVGPSGGTVWSIQYQNAATGTAIIGTGRGIYRTQDEGQSWSRVLNFPEPSIGQAIAVNPANRDRALLIGPRVYRSVDAGASWNFPSGPPAQVDVPIEIAFSFDGAVAWISDQHGRVFRSIDEGASWQDRSTGLPLNGPPVAEIAVDPANRDIAYARSGPRLYKTLNGGTTWTRIPGDFIDYIDITASPRVAGLIVATRTVGMTRSTDYGETWSTPVASGHYHVQFASDAQGSVLSIDTFGGVQRSNDAGLSWAPVGDLPVASVIEIAINPVNANRALVATMAGVLMTTDGGATWTDRSSGIDEAIFGRPLLAQDGTGAVFAPSIDAEVLYRRDPATGAWQGVGRQVAAAIGFLGRVGDVRAGVHPADSQLLYISRGSSLVRSTNGGGSWQLLTSSLMADAITFDATNPLVGYAATSNLRMQKTVDGGANWTLINNGLPALSFRQVLIDPANPQVIYIAGDAGAAVYRSVDAGASWSPANAGIQNLLVHKLAFAPDNSAVLYAATTDGLFKSANSGGSWTAIYRPTAPGSFVNNILDVVVDPVVPSIVYASHFPDERMLRSVDAGQTWERLPPIIAGTNSRVTYLALLPSQPTVVVAAKENAGLHEMRILPDLRFTNPNPELYVESRQTADLSFRNASQNAAVRARLTATLPAASDQYSVVTNKAGCSQSARDLTCAFDVLQPGETANVTVSFTPANIQEDLLAQVTAHGSVPGLFETRAQMRTRRRINLHLSLVSDVTTAAVGASITYIMTVANAGPSPALNVRANMVLPDNMTFVSTTGTGATCTRSGGVVSCEAASIAPGTSVQGRVTVTAASGGTATTNATAQAPADAFDHDPTNNFATVNVTVQSPSAPAPASGSSRGGGGAGGELLLLIGMIELARRHRRRLASRHDQHSGHRELSISA